MVKVDKMMEWVVHLNFPKKRCIFSYLSLHSPGLLVEQSTKSTFFMTFLGHVAALFISLK